MVEVGIDGCETDCWHDVDESPAPEIVQERKSDGRVSEHVERGEEVPDAELTTWNHVAFE